MKKILILSFVILSLVACSNSSQEENLSNNDAELYTITTDGYGGEVYVTLKVNNNNKIIDIVAQGPNETENIGSIALEQIANEILNAKTTDVDVISGATITSNAVIDGVNRAIELSNTSF